LALPRWAIRCEGGRQIEQDALADAGAYAMAGAFDHGISGFAAWAAGPFHAPDEGDAVCLTFAEPVKEVYRRIEPPPARAPLRDLGGNAWPAESCASTLLAALYRKPDRISVVKTAAFLA
jgi:hypothetical protein